jgi:hypothetical protein
MTRANVYNPSHDGKAVSLNTADADGVKKSVATSTSAVEYETTDLDGDDMDGTLGVFAGGVPRAVSVTTSSSAATYNTTDPITVEGYSWLDGRYLVESLTLTAAGGGETISGTVMFDSAKPIKINVPAQTTTSGAFTFGTTTATAIVPPCHSICVNDTSGGNVIQYRLANMDPDSTPLTGGVAVQYDEKAWSVAEIHASTTVAGIVAHWGMERPGA